MRLLAIAFVALAGLALYEVDRAWRLALEQHVHSAVSRLPPLSPSNDMPALQPALDAGPAGRSVYDESDRLVGPGLDRQREIRI